MNKRIYVIAISFALFMASNLASAYTSYGGGQSCGSYLSEMHANSRKHGGDKGFIAGFLTGVAFANPKYDPKQVDFDGILKWIENYCTKEPLSDITDALEALTHDLNKAK